MNRDDLHAEFALIGGIMQYPSEVVAIDDNAIHAEHFQSPDMRHAFGAVLALIGRGKDVDLIAVFDELRSQGVSADLEVLNAAIQSISSPRSVRPAAEALAKSYARREVRQALADSLDFAMEHEAAESLDLAQSNLAKLQDHLGRGEPKDAPELVQDRLEYYEQLLRGEHVSSAMPTHIPALDRALHGGLEAGRLYILAARPGVGKSSLAEHISLKIAQGGNRVLFCSLEMPAAEVVDRAVANLGDVSYEVIQGVGDPDDSVWGRILDGTDRLRTLPFSVDDKGSLSLGDVRAKAHAVKRRGLKVLVFDYLQLCASTRENRNSEIEAITKGLKTLAKDLGIAVLLLSQLNRDIERRADKRPMLADLRDSGSIEQDADVVMFLWPPNPENKNEIMLAVEKNRQGKRALVSLHFDGDKQRWGQAAFDIALHLKKQPLQSKKGFDDSDVR
jgi:replicative DNA helicase